MNNYIPVKVHIFFFNIRNQVPTFAVRETDVSRHNGGTSGAPLKPLRDDSALMQYAFKQNECFI